MSNKFSQGELRSELHTAKQTGAAGMPSDRTLYYMLHESAESSGIPFAYVLALGSRETNLQNIRGDFRGGIYHGYGPLQGDIQHEFVQVQALTGEWKTKPEKLAGFCLGILRDNLIWARKAYPKMNEYQHLKVALSSYNATEARVRSGVALGNSDLFTTGHDYAADVLARAAVFNLILAGG